MSTGTRVPVYECEVVPTPEERDVYAAARWAWLTPEART